MWGNVSIITQPPLFNKLPSLGIEPQTERAHSSTEANNLMAAAEEEQSRSIIINRYVNLAYLL